MVIIGLLIGMIVMQFILEKINNLDLKLINGIHITTRKMRNKKITEYGLMILVGGVFLGFIGMASIPGIVQGIIVGGIWAVIAFCFEDTFFDNMRNTLR